MSDSDREKLVNDMLADMCGLIGKTITLIPPEHAEERLSACAFLLDQINNTIKRTLTADKTEH
jgi:2-phospho-L-lactate guanylyltransferase (CobY/MobA/RfbA family)